MKPYLYMIKIKLLLALTYRFEVFITFISQIILLFASAFFWKAAFAGIETVAGITERQMLIYSVISLILGSLFSTTVEENIRQKIRKGNVAVDFIKPVNIFFLYFSEDIGNMITAAVQKIIPILLFSSAFIVVPAPVSVVHFMLFFISACLSYLIIWLISAIFGLFYFWAIDIGPLGEIKKYIILILSGSVVPIWFYPGIVQRILEYLPFIYIYQLPVSIFIGKASAADALKGIFVQLIWILIFAFVFHKLRNSAEKNILVQGG